MLTSSRRWPQSLKIRPRDILCQRCLHQTGLRRDTSSTTQQYQPDSHAAQPTTHVRKQIKDEARVKKQARKGSKKSQKIEESLLEKWELTVGIEIHAELNTDCKLFSAAKTSLSSTPNAHAAPFDTAIPGTQPLFQRETLLPAIRAALAFGCQIQPTSTWDRKHYFWWDQPNGYQITQYNAPFARGGMVCLRAHVDIDAAEAHEDDGRFLNIDLKQVQMEQDTAKTTLQPPSTYLLDFNRASHPLIEIISRPQIHSPTAAAAFVRKVQEILQAVGANTTGMEMGGLRADVNVSVRRRDDPGTRRPSRYEDDDDVAGLGQRTEIKNLSSIKAVEEAVIAERDRQISVLESGGVIEGETRGWTLGSSETKRLRGKEGEVDYRYMPDPDLGVVRIGEDLVSHLRKTLPILPDDSLVKLVYRGNSSLSMKDAKTLVDLDEGRRLEFYHDTLDLLRADLDDEESDAWQQAAKLTANWVLMDLPTHLASSGAPFPYNIPAPSPTTAPQDLQLSTYTLAGILTHLSRGDITTVTARHLLSLLTSTPDPSSPSPSTRPSSTTTTPDPSSAILPLQTPNPATAPLAALIDAHNLRLHPLTDAEYTALAARLVADNPDMAAAARARVAKVGFARARGKVAWFVGQMVRADGVEGRVVPERAEQVVRDVLGV